MEYFKEHLTTEELHRKFTNQFDLVNYAISLAENMLKTGRDPRVKIDAQNRALQVLEEIAEGKDKFDDLPIPVPTHSADMIAVTQEIIIEEDEGSRPMREKRKGIRNPNALRDEKPKRRKVLVE